MQAMCYNISMIIWPMKMFVNYWGHSAKLFHFSIKNCRFFSPNLLYYLYQVAYTHWTTSYILQ